MRNADPSQGEGRTPIETSRGQGLWPLWRRLRHVLSKARPGDSTLHPVRQWPRNATCCQGRSGLARPPRSISKSGSSGSCPDGTRQGPFGHLWGRSTRRWSNTMPRCLLGLLSEGCSSACTSAMTSSVFVSVQWWQLTSISESPITFHSTQHPCCNPETERQGLIF